MKKSLLFMLLVVSLGANDKIQQNQLQNQQQLSEHKKTLTKEEQYKKYQEELEKRNKQLEDDGFCACNNE